VGIQGEKASLSEVFLFLLTCKTAFLMFLFENEKVGIHVIPNATTDATTAPHMVASKIRKSCVTYMEKFGPCVVPLHDPVLGQWVEQQRREYTFIQDGKPSARRFLTKESDCQTQRHWFRPFDKEENSKHFNMCRRADNTLCLQGPIRFLIRR
jgi:hypothetical protein